MKKLLSVCLALIMVLSLCCLASAEDEEINLVITTSLYVEEPHQKALDALIAAYKKVKPNVNISVYGANYISYFDNITAEIVANTEPDIIQMYQDNIARYDSIRLGGTFVDLTPYIEGTEYEKLTSQEYCKVDGKYKAISSYAASTSAIFYRKSLLQAADIDPATIVTWDDLRDACIKLTDGNRYGIGLIVAAHTFTANEWARMIARPISGGVYFKGNEGIDAGYTIENINANHPANVYAAEFWTKLIQEDKCARIVDTKGNARELFWNGELAFNHDGSWFVGMCEARDPALMDDIGVIPVPKVVYNGETYKANPTLYAVVSCVSNASKHPEEAIAFLQWMTTPEAQELIEVSGMIPSNAKYVEDSNYAERHELAYKISSFQNSVYGDVLVSDPAIAEQGALQSILVDCCQEIFTGAIGAQEGLNEAAEQMKALLSEE